MWTRKMLERQIALAEARFRNAETEDQRYEAEEDIDDFSRELAVLDEQKKARETLGN